ARSVLLIFILIVLLPTYTLFPYTTLFRSILSALGTFVVWQMVQSHSIVQAILMIAGAGSLAYIIYYAAKFLDKVARDRLLALTRSEEHTSELQSRFDIVCRLLLEKNNDIL